MQSCCTCFDDIKKSYIKCHNLCRKCYIKLNNKLNFKTCPVCRQLMELSKPSRKGVIDVEYINKGSMAIKTINMSNLKRFVFSNNFKQLLIHRLNGTGVVFKKNFVLIKYKKYLYGEIVPLKDFAIIRDNGLYNDSTMVEMAGNLIIRDILTPIDYFLIKNYVSNIDKCANIYHWGESYYGRKVLLFAWSERKEDYTSSN